MEVLAIWHGVKTGRVTGKHISTILCMTNIFLGAICDTCQSNHAFCGLQGQKQQSACAVIAESDGAHGCCSTIELTAKRQHKVGEEVTLDYGQHPLQHMICQYGFVPTYGSEGAVYEVFEDFGIRWEALIVQASPRVSTLLLTVIVSMLIGWSYQDSVCFQLM